MCRKLHLFQVHKVISCLRPRCYESLILSGLNEQVFHQPASYKSKYHRHPGGLLCQFVLGCFSNTDLGCKSAS